MAIGVYERENNPRFWEGRRKASLTLRKHGVKPNLLAIAGSLASRQLNRIGTTRKESPALYKRYQEYWLKILEERQNGTSIEGHVPQPSGDA